MESKKINQLATNVNPQTSDLTTIGDPITGQLKKITWLQVANLIGAQASVTLQQVTDNGNTTTDPITTGGLTLTNLGTGVPQLTNGNFAGTYGYGLANGVATLDSGGKIPASQLPSSVMEYKGTWNASTNTPTLADGTGDNGDVYLVNVAGSQNLGSGTISFAVGDWVVYNGTIWQKSLNSNAVASVFGRTGTIVAQEGDYNIDQLGDVAITSAATNDYLRYNGSSWVNTQFPTFVSSDKLVLQVRNNSGATINKGTVVYINGATAGYPTIAKAQADADNTSAQTLGLVQDNISNNSNGVVVIVGQITGIDTSAYPAGTQLYLSGTTAGAFTSTKTLAPTHLVYVGIVTTQNAVNGVIEVKIQNGYELDEIHDVAISSVANNQGLFYESSTSLWKNKSIATVLGYTPEQPLTFSAPLSRSTNTVSIPAATGSVNGYLTSTDWTTFNNKLTSPMTTLGDIIFGGTSGNANRLAGNITTTKQYLSQTGTGTESASPTWATITGSDITGAALTKSDDTNVTLTLGGTPATALLRAASLTLGWTGTLAVSRGGTGASSFGSNEIIYGNSASALQSSNQFTFSPTGVFFINNTISAGGIAMNLTSTVNAAANNDIIYGVRISPTFNNLSFTGVTQRALGVFGDVYINGTITSGAWGGSTITIAKGGTGLTALGTAGQLLRVNSGATALEYWTPTYISAAITSLNGLTDSVQTFATGTTGTDFNISSASGVHTFNIPSASAANRGLVTTGSQTFAGAKTFNAGVTFVSTDPFSFISNSNTGTFDRSVIYANQNNTSGDNANGIFIERGRLTDSGSAEIRQFVIGARGGSVQWRLDKDGNSFQTGSVNATNATFNGNITLNGSTTRSINFYNDTNANLNAQIQYDQIASNSGQLFFGTNNAGTFATRLTIGNTGAATFSSVAAGYGLSVTNVEDSSQGLLVRSTDADTTLYLARFQSSASTVSQTWVDRFSIAKNGSTVIGDNIPAVNVRLWVKGSDQTASNYAMDVTDSLGQSIAWFRNDKAIRFYGALTGTSATFSSSVTAINAVLSGTGSTFGDGLRINRSGIPTQYTIINHVGGASNFISVDASGNNVPEIYFQRSINGTSVSNSMMINKDGKVGIGTDTPDYLFTIDGQTGDASTVTLSRFYASKGQSGAAYLQIQGTRHPTASVRRMILDAYDGGGASVNLILQQSGGNVGIGTVTPTNGKLEIQQGATTAALWAQTGGTTSSYVIADFRTGTNLSALQIQGNGSSIFGGNITTNSPSAGNTGEGIIAGTSFKIDASGTGQKAKMYVVSKDLSDTYGSGLQIQFANQADTLGFGFNLTTAGTYETYIKDSSANWQRRFSISNAGNVSIGTTGATRRLQVVGSTVGNTLLHNQNNASGDRTLIMQLGGSNTDNTSSYYIFCDTDAVGVKMVVYGNGNVANVNNSYGAYSDIKLKENIIDATPKLQDLLKVKIRNFNLKGTDKKHIGVIAQELEQIFPALIEESDDTIKDENGEQIKTGEKTKSVKYSVFVPMLIKAIQEQQAQIEELKSKLA